MLANTTSILAKFASIVDQVPGVYQPETDLESDITSLATKTVIGAAIALTILTAIAMLSNNRVPKLKLPLFTLMSISMAGSAIVLIASTVYLNVKADSGGPVHWHADIEFWACGNELELRNPTGTLSNKVGTAVLHEHDDHRIHLEGVVVKSETDATLGKFMHVVGGAITEDALVVPLDEDVDLTFENDLDADNDTDGDGVADGLDPTLVEPYIMQDGENGRVAYFTSGQTCGDQVAEVQTFVYRFNEEDNTYKQHKLDEQESLEYFGVERLNQFSIYEDSNVPPGDCIIVEFDRPKSKTDKLCEQYGVRDVERCEAFGVEPEKREICQNTQVDYDGNENYYLDEEPDVLGISTESSGEPDNNLSLIEILGIRAGRAVIDSASAEAELLGSNGDGQITRSPISNLGGQNTESGVQQ